MPGSGWYPQSADELDGPCVRPRPCRHTAWPSPGAVPTSGGSGRHRPIPGCGTRGGFPGNAGCKRAARSQIIPATSSSKPGRTRPLRRLTAIKRSLSWPGNLNFTGHITPNAIQPRYASYLKAFAPPPDASPDAAAASAMYVVLSGMVPAQKNAFDDAYKSIIAKIPDGEAKEHGVVFGGEVAKAFLEVRANDGMSATAEYKPLTGPGQWQPTPPAKAAMAIPQLANVLPFTTKTFGFLKVEGPPALDSAAYARDIDEIRQVGSRNSTTRTADQTASAIFWYISTPVPWEAAARAAAQKINPGLFDNARIFALMNMSGAPSFIPRGPIQE